MIYVDTLVFVNTIIDYIFLLLTCLITKRDYSIKRLLPASFLGGLSSLYILVEGSPTLLDVLFKFSSGLVIIIVAQKFTGIKNLFIFYVIFLSISFLLCGAVEFAETFFGDSILSENLVSYFYMSPLLLILITIIVYITVLLIRRFLDRKNFSSKALLRLSVKGIEREYDALIDTGSNLRDPFSEAQVFVLDESMFREIKFALDHNEVEKRRRLIPASTVNGSTLLEGIRCDRATVLNKDEAVSFNNPIIACSQRKLSDEKAIVSYLSLNRLSDKRGRL